MLRGFGEKKFCGIPENPYLYQAICEGCDIRHIKAHRLYFLTDETWRFLSRYESGKVDAHAVLYGVGRFASSSYRVRQDLISGYVNCPRFLCLMANTSFNPLNFCYEGMDSFFDDGICLDFCRDLLFKGR